MKKRLLAFVLAFALIVSVMPVNVLATETGAVAQVGNQFFTNLQEAIATAETTYKETGKEQTVVLLKDYTPKDSELAITEKVTLTAEPGAELTIGWVRIAVRSSGTLTLEDITINTIGSYYAMLIDGDVVINEGTHIKGTQGAYVMSGTLVMNDGVIEVENIAITTVHNGKAEINGGVVRSENDNAIAATAGTVTINGGLVETMARAGTLPGGMTACAAYAGSGATINVTGGEIKAAAGYGLVAKTDGTVKISGGTINHVLSWESTTAKVEITGGTVTGAVRAMNGATLTITGGRFVRDVQAYCAEGYYWNPVNGLVYNAGNVHDSVLDKVLEFKDYAHALRDKVLEIVMPMYYNLHDELIALHEVLKTQTLELNTKLETLTNEEKVLLNKMIAERDQLAADLDALQARLEEVKSGANVARTGNTDKEQLIADLEAAIAETVAEIAKLDDNIAALTAKIEADELSIDGLKASIIAIQNQILATQDELAAVEAAVKNLTADLKVLYDACLVLGELFNENLDLEDLYNPNVDTEAIKGEAKDAWDALVGKYSDLSLTDIKDTVHAVMALIDKLPAIKADVEEAYDATLETIEKAKAAANSAKVFAESLKGAVDTIVNGVEYLKNIEGQKLDAVLAAAAAVEEALVKFVDDGLIPTVEDLEEVYNLLKETALDEWDHLKELAFDAETNEYLQIVLQALINRCIEQGYVGSGLEIGYMYTEIYLNKLGEYFRWLDSKLIFGYNWLVDNKDAILNAMETKRDALVAELLRIEAELGIEPNEEAREALFKAYDAVEAELKKLNNEISIIEEDINQLVGRFLDLQAEAEAVEKKMVEEFLALFADIEAGDLAYDSYQTKLDQLFDLLNEHNLLDTGYLFSIVEEIPGLATALLADVVDLFYDSMDLVVKLQNVDELYTLHDVVVDEFYQNVHDLKETLKMEVCSKLCKLYTDITNAYNAFNEANQKMAAIREALNAVLAAKDASEEELAALSNALNALATELDILDDQMIDLYNAGVKIIDEIKAIEGLWDVLGSFVEEIDPIVNTLPAYAELLKRAAELAKIDLVALYDELTHTDYVIGEENFYVSLGDASANNFFAQVAEQLGVESLNLAADGLRPTDIRYILDATFAADEYTAGKFEAAALTALRAEYTAALAKADLITISVGAGNFSQFADAQAMGLIAEWINVELKEYMDNKYIGSYVKEGLTNMGIDLTATKNEMNWEAYIGATGVKYLKEALELLEIDLIEQGLKNFEIDVFEMIEMNEFAGKEILTVPVIDMVMYMIESYLYAYVTYSVDYVEVFNLIHAIAPNAELLIVGMGAEELVFTYEETTIDLSEYVGYIIGATNLQHFGYAALVENTTYVCAPEAEAVMNALNISYAPVVVLGDVNGDGKINTTDARLIMQYNLGIEGVELDLAAADVDGNGKINTTDARLILQLNLGIITEFPIAQ